jgi:threonine dehydrogenase-like Zn-dependent dehydrogenase
MHAPGSAVVTEAEEPVADEYEAEVEMVACGICNSTDRMLRQGTFAPGVQYPSILGHESVGRVTAVGDRVRYLQAGQLVTRCSAYGWGQPPVKMYWGGFAERGVVRDWRAWQEDHPGAPQTDNFAHVAFDPAHSPEDIALSISLAETWSVAAAAGGMVGNVVGVSGTGIAGLSFVFYARLLGAERVVCVGRRPERTRLAVELGATDIAMAGEGAGSLFRDLGGADVVFEASGSEAGIASSYRWARPGGRLIIYSAPEAPVPLDVMGSPRDASLVIARPREGAVMKSVLQMLESGMVPREKLVSGTYPLERIGEAFDDIDQGLVVKALVRFD